MADYGIKILKPNAPSQYSVLNAPPRYLTILSSVESHKIFVKSSAYCGTSGYTYYHNLGYVPAVMAWKEESDGSLSPVGIRVYTNKLEILGYNQNVYFIIFFEG